MSNSENLSAAQQFIGTLFKENPISNSLMAKTLSLEPFIGNTPLFPIRYEENENVKIFAKLEWQQIGGSVKARPAFNIIKTAVASGALTEDKVLLDATSGNTGIAYASIASALGIPLELCVPENISEERRIILRSLGAKLTLTSPFEGTDGAQIRAKELVEAYPNKYCYADQYANNANWLAHYKTTAEEIITQTSGKITHFVAGLGTTGTFVGTSRRLKEFNEKIQLTSLQPEIAMHGLEGWKHLETAIVPKIYDNTVADQVLEVPTLTSYEMVKRIARNDGLLVSPSAGANLAGAIKVAGQLEQGVVVTTFADSADKYGEVMKEIF